MQPTYDQWLALYEAARCFKKLKPWQSLEECHTFIVCDPATGMKGYGSITGKGGEHFSLTLYPGIDGLRSFCHMVDINYLHEVHPLTNPIFNFMQDYLMCSFEDKYNLLEEEVLRLKELGLSFRGSNGWPQVKKGIPGAMPSTHLTTSECSLLTYALEQVMHYLPFIKKGKLQLTPISSAKALPLLGDTISYEPFDFEGMLAIPPVRWSNDLLANRIKKMKKDSHFQLEGGLYLLPIPLSLMEENGKAPYAAVGQSESGVPLFLGFKDTRHPMLMFDDLSTDAKEGTTFDKRQDALLQAFADWLLTLPYKPGHITVDHTYSYALLTDFCKQCAIPLTLAPLTEQSYAVLADHTLMLIEECLKKTGLIFDEDEWDDDWEDDADLWYGGNEDLDDDYDEEEIQESMAAWHQATILFGQDTCEDFLGSSFAQHFSQEEQEFAHFIIPSFVDTMFILHHELPCEWTKESMELWCLETVPAYLTIKASPSTLIKPVLGAYLKYLQADDAFRDGEALAHVLEKHNVSMIERIQDPTLWKPTKQLATTALNAGVDLNDKKAFDAFIADYNNPFAPTPIPIINGKKIGRNEPCPCGSGKKYKHCCGKH